MKIHKNIIPILICALAASCTSAKDQASHIPQSWRANSNALPEESENSKITSSMDRMLNLGLSTLESQSTSGQDSEQKSQWKLRGLMWNFGVSSSGILGLVFGSGKVGLETIYTRKDISEKSTTSLKDTTLSAMEFTGTEKTTEIPPQFEATIRSLVSKGKLRNEAHLRKELISATDRFREMIRAVKSVPDSLHNFYLHGIQIELSFDAEGNLVAPISAGTSLGFRFNWVREKSTNHPDSDDEPKTEFGKNMSRQLGALVQNISADMDSLVEGPTAENINSNGYQLMEIKPYIAIGQEGNIGIASVSSEWLAMLRFYRKENPSKELTKLAPPSENLPVFVGNTESGSIIIQANHWRFTRGLRRAMKIANFFAQRSNGLNSSKWQLKEFSPSFEVTKNGSIGLVSVEGTAGIEISFSKLEQ